MNEDSISNSLTHFDFLECERGVVHWLNLDVDCNREEVVEKERRDRGEGSGGRRTTWTTQSFLHTVLVHHILGSGHSW